MIFQKLPLDGLYLLQQERHNDQRGYFARTFCAKEFLAQGLPTNFVQANLSYNPQKGTVRGMHYQREPQAECKIVSCVCGSIYDCALDIRSSSPTYGQVYGTELSAANGKMLYIPEGFAHGFQVLADNSIVHYLINAFYEPSLNTGFNIADLPIAWPLATTLLSARDQALLPLPKLDRQHDRYGI